MLLTFLGLWVQAISKTTTSVSNKAKRISDPDDVNRWSSFVYMLCTLLKSSSLPDSDKLAQYFKLVELSRQGPPEPFAQTPPTGQGQGPGGAPLPGGPPPATTAPAGPRRPKEEKVPPLKDRFGAIDRILEKLELGNIAFNAPRSINLHDTAVIQLMLGLATPIDELKRMIEAEGEKEGARIRVSDHMEDRLSGFNFAITAINPEIQVVSRSYVTEWKWEIKPSSEGRQYRHLTISALLAVDDISALRAIRTFDRVIEVEVAWHQRVGLFVEKNWQWLWAALLVPIVGWLWKRMKGTKSSIRHSDNFSYVDLEVRILAGHPLRVVRVIVDAALARLTDDFEAIYAPIGWPSIPPEQLLRALLSGVLHGSFRAAADAAAGLQSVVPLVRWSRDRRSGVGRHRVQQEPRSALG
jgi:hypothetical protein